MTDTNEHPLPAQESLSPSGVRPSINELSSDSLSSLQAISTTPSPDRPPPNASDVLPTETPADPKVAALLAMFPGFDTSLLQSVLESVACDQDRAVDVLLGMSDPSYTSTESADAIQTELDAEIARRLMLEESEQQASWRPRNVRGDPPYQPRTSHTSPVGAPQRPAEGDSVGQFQEQLGRFAETGKKTFNTFLSKVKAKMQEFDSPSGQGQPSSSTRPLPGGDSWSTPAQSQAYYEPNPPISVQGYEVGATETLVPPTSTTVQPIPSANSVVTTVVSSSPSITPGAPMAGNVDPSKIGLLPKRPVSLGSSPQPSRNLADDEEVEYVENPFEESTHR